MKVKIKSKLHCIVWCIKNGIIKPNKYFLTRIGSFKENEHNFFSWGKLRRCGKSYNAEKCVGKPNYYECFGYEFHKYLIELVE